MPRPIFARSMHRLRINHRTEFPADLLGLEGFEVVHQQDDAGEKVWRFTIVPRLAAGVCPGCGQVSTDRHQKRDRERIHDLPIGDSRVELTVRTFQYRCAACERCLTPPCAALADGDAQSRATGQLILPDLESLARWREPGRGAEPHRRLSVGSLSGLMIRRRLYPASSPPSDL